VKSCSAGESLVNKGALNWDIRFANSKNYALDRLTDLEAHHPSIAFATKVTTNRT
jgi:hypothetical protein